MTAKQHTPKPKTPAKPHAKPPAKKAAEPVGDDLGPLLTRDTVPTVDIPVLPTPELVQGKVAALPDTPPSAEDARVEPEPDAAETQDTVVTENPAMSGLTFDPVSGEQTKAKHRR